MFSPQISRKRRYDEGDSYDVQVIFELGSSNTQYPMSSALPCFSENTESSALQFYGLGTQNTEINELVGPDNRFSSPKITKIFHTNEPFTKKQCFTYFSKDFGSDNHGSIISENIFSPIFVKEDIADRCCTRACHICRRKPSQKNESELYSFCENCHNSTCLICLRHCSGRKLKSSEGREQVFHPIFLSENAISNNSNIHYEKICSRCCVEQGTIGEVRCFGCLNQMA
ncbi:hypothetical protein HI914_02301 [Erysiphe necator]|uniref:Uncharacterized protein n=1 Tax=Uncinula necator TaxID=52586 RepID=A0A0B1P652_UNCNE|nr:hypothetical protein HI914_02301 [Erysiphe necator]KHJ33743.1 hypothetical protein EV44_g5154 [Erysiphe necator]